jgi:oligopeptidase A
MLKRNALRQQAASALSKVCYAFTIGLIKRTHTMLSTMGLPQFSGIDVAHYTTHLEHLLKKNLECIERVLLENQYYTWDNLMYPLDDLADALERFWSPFSHLHSVMDSESLRTCYQDCLPLLSAYDAAISHNKKLYESMTSLNINDLNEVQKKILADSLQEFELSGVGLGLAEQQRFEVIQARLSELSNQFEHHVLDATQAFTIHLHDDARHVGLPEHALNTAKELAEQKEVPGYLLTLEYPSFQAVMTHAEDRSLREQMYYAYVTRASDQGPNAKEFDNSSIMNEMLALRHEKANLLGLKNYAELSIATKMAESTEQVTHFLSHLVNRVKNQAKEEFHQLESFAKNQFNMEAVKPWDVPYLSEKRRQVLYSLSQEELRPYFTQPNVMKGLFTIIKKLYGVRLEEVKGIDVWHKDVQCYILVDEHNHVRGYVYTDLYSRPHKRGGAWMDSLQSRRKLEDGSIQLPIATLTCNFAKPSGTKPALLSHDEVTTLFHEMGHCLHHLLTQVNYLGASGINGVEWDAVELPSQFFEHWCWEQKALSLLTAHVDTGAPLPDALFEQLNLSKNFQSALAIIRQLEFSLFDFTIHQQYPDRPSFIEDALTEVRLKTNITPITPYNRFQNSFSHLFGGGYAAGYYSYIWAEVLSSDAFSRFEEEGVFNSQTGAEFLKSILEVGGSKPALEAYKEFRGRPATIDSLLRHRGIE